MNSKLLYISVLGTIFMLSPFAIDMYLPALPMIADSLVTGIDALEATVAIYLFGFALGQLVLGPVSDAFGRQRILVAGLTVYTAASFMAGTAATLEQLYLWRFLQALGGAGAVGVFPLIRSRFGERGGAQVISYVLALTVVAPLIAPIIGGYVLALAGWRAIFLVLGGLGVLAVLAAMVIIRDGKEDLRPLSMRRILKAYGRVLAEPRIVAAIAAGGFAFAGLFAFVAGSPFVYISFFGVAPENYGYLVGLNALAMIVANLVNAQVLKDADPVAKIYGGALLLALSGLAVLVTAVFDMGLAALVVTVVFFVGGLGFTATNSIVAALSVMPEENGTVAAINGAGQFAIGAVSSLIVSVLASTTAMPMALIMAACGLLAFIAAWVLRNVSENKGAEHA